MMKPTSPVQKVTNEEWPISMQVIIEELDAARAALLALEVPDVTCNEPITSKHVEPLRQLDMVMKRIAGLYDTTCMAASIHATYVANPQSN